MSNAPQHAKENAGAAGERPIRERRAQSTLVLPQHDHQRPGPLAYGDGHVEFFTQKRFQKDKQTILEVTR